MSPFLFNFSIKFSAMKDTRNIIPKVLLIAGFISQLICIFLVGDKELVPEWSIYVDSLLQFGNYSYYWEEFSTGWVPSAYLPPLYPVFLYLLVSFIQPLANSISEISTTTVRIVELIQVGVWMINVYLVYNITNLIFGDTRTSVWASALFIVFPLSIVLPSQISSINIYLVLILSLLLHIIKLDKQDSDSFFTVLSISLFSILLLLSRTETILYVPFIISYIFLKTNWKKTILFFILILITIGSITFRNYSKFNQSMILSTSTGYNLWRGHNESSNAYGIGIIGEDLQLQLNSIPKTVMFEITQSDVYKNYALNYMRNNPKAFFSSAYKKFMALWIYDSNTGDQSYSYVTSFWYWFPWLIYLIIAIIGIIIIKGQGLKYFLILIIGVTITSVVLFTLPRYRMHILPIIAIYCSLPISILFNRYK